MRKGRRMLNGLLLLLMLVILSACGVTTEDVKTRMEKHLYEKYGEEFVVDRIGERSANGQKFYQARIYPKSIIGTNKEGDSYYYASASIDLLFGGSKLAKEVGDSYSFINRNDDVENYLLPKAKEIFGERIRLKADVKHEVTGDGSWWAGYKSSSLKEMRDDIKKEPDRTRIVSTLYLYIFDRIDSEEEKEKRREQIFEFIQYLKGEGLFEYLEMNINLMDDIVLAPSFKNLEYELERKNKSVEIDLRNEIKNLKSEIYFNNLKIIPKSELNLKRGKIGTDYCRGIFQVISKGYLENVDKHGRYRDAKEKNELEKHNYKSSKDIDYYEWKYYKLREEM